MRGVVIMAAATGALAPISVTRVASSRGAHQVLTTLLPRETTLHVSQLRWVKVVRCMVHGAWSVVRGAWCVVRDACGKGHGAKVHRVKEGEKGREKKRGRRSQRGPWTRR